jgi:hypothetical protein
VISSIMYEILWLRKNKKKTMFFVISSLGPVGKLI